MQRTTNWQTLLILIVLIAGTGIFLLSSLGFGITSLYVLVSGGNDPAGAMIASLATGFEAVLTAVTARSVLRKHYGRAEEDALLRLPFANWHILILLVAMGIAVVFGAVISLLEVKILSWLILPILTLVLIVPPIWILLGLGTRKLNFGPRWRALGIFGIGLTLGPLVMITLEFSLLLVLVVMGGILLAQKPDLLVEITQLASMLQNETNPDAILTQLAPYLIKPVVIQATFGFVALAVPMIEEMLKPLGVWLFARKIETPAQGFALGLLSGAAYALMESLGASGQGNMGWALIVSIRAGTSMLHIVTSGLMGWAIVAALHERRYWRLVGTYAVVILLHGIWNGSAVGAGFAVISDYLQNTSWSFSLLPAAFCGMSVLIVGMVVLLIALNRRVLKLSALEPVHLNAEAESPNPENPEGVK